MHVPSFPPSARGAFRRLAIRFAAVLFAFALSAGAPSAPRAEIGAENLPLVSERGVEWSRVRGINYLPSNAASPYYAWRDYDPDRTRLELFRAWRFGFNSVRVFLSHSAYEEAPSRFLENFADFVEACREAGLTLMPVLFDAWGVEYDPRYQMDFVGKNDDPTQARLESVREAYDRFVSRPDAYAIDKDAYSRKLGYIAETLIPSRKVPATRDPSAPYWASWSPSPGRSAIESGRTERCFAYAKAVVEAHRDEPLILAWDVVNAPDASKLFGAPVAFDPIMDFVSEAMRAVRSAGPSQAATVSAAGGYHGASAFALKTDLLAFHYFDRNPADIVAHVSAGRRRASDVIVTGVGAVMFPTSETDVAPDRQADLVRRTVLFLERERVGYYLWHFCEGEGLTPWAALCARDGSPTPAMRWLVEHWKR